MYDLLVFIGRFQPFHNGHKAVVDAALKQAKQVLVLVGGAGKARSPRNPWTFNERKLFIEEVYGNDVLVEPLQDFTYRDEKWVAQVQSKVRETLLGTGWTPNGIKDFKVGLIGHSKDESSYYLKLFPEMDSVNVPMQGIINATDIRNDMFEHKTQLLSVPRDIATYFGTIPGYGVWSRLKEEYEFYKQYRKDWGPGPYMTGDSIVQVGGHILLVERGRMPGKGTLALPGGFINLDEKIMTGIMRELREETRLKVPEPVLRGSIQNFNVYDDPHRSERGRIVTHCAHIKLQNELELPKVKGSDDAKKAMWVSIADLKESEMFEDHYHIIHHMLGL